MFRQIILNILSHEANVLIVGLTIVIICRSIYFKVTNNKVIFYKEALILLFTMYLICLFYVVTFTDASWTTSNFIPFKEILRYKFGSPLFIKNVIGNILMFVPFGFFLGYFLKIKKKRWVIVLVVVISTIIELLQDYIGRVFDIDDILLNLVGGMLGYLVYDAFNKIKRGLPKFLKKNFIYNIIVIVLLVLFIVYLSNIMEVVIYE